MRILAGQTWKEGFLDYHRNPREYRLAVVAWKNLEKLEHVYHTRPKSLRLLWNYLPVVGPEGLLIKTWSRIREEHRNQKYVACGFATVLEEGEGSAFKKGEIIGFLAPLAPPLAERIVLPEELLFALDAPPSGLPEGRIAYVAKEAKEPAAKWWESVRGWSAYAGIAIPPAAREALRRGFLEEMRQTEWENAAAMAIDAPSAIATTKGEARQRGAKKTGVLFGYGNYAKINILPYSRPYVDISSVHEIDPTQIFLERNVGRWDASPLPKPDEKYDVYFVASYNHTHVPITLHALRQGAYAVVEKPVVNDYEELAALEEALKTAGRKVFIGFHKRYGLFNRMALKDLGVEYGEPISYHSVVYELIQPEFFWYNWPVSRSTFFANGCHQIDHFLHLNNFSKPKDFDIKLLQDHAVEVWIELRNGATFTTTFSEKGVSRVGPRDHVELKVHGRNVTITDNIRYMSETDTRIIRKMRVFKTVSYKTMYQEIGRKIAANEDGDSLESIMISSKIMLDLEARLEKMKGWGDRYPKAKQEFERYLRP